MFLNKKFILYSLELMLLLTSCNSVYYSDLPETERKIVCNCLFSPNEKWQVELSYTHRFLDPLSIEYVDNAIVFIESAKKDTIFLENSGNGKYKADCTPKIDESYRVNIIKNTDTITSRFSSIPQATTLCVKNVDTKPGKVPVGFLSYDHVYEIFCNIKMVKTGAFIKINAYYFDPGKDDRLYVLDSRFIDILEDYNVTKKTINYLKNYENDTITLMEYDKIANLIKQYAPYHDYNMIVQQREKAYCCTAIITSKAMFNLMEAFSPAVLFHEFINEDYTLMAELKTDTDFPIVLYNYYEEQYWLNISTMSKEIYKYYLSYIYQLQSRADMNSIKDPIFSNMSNGVGIFGGIQNQLIKIPLNEE